MIHLMKRLKTVEAGTTNTSRNSEQIKRYREHSIRYS